MSAGPPTVGADSPQRRKARALLRAMVVAYVVVGAAGFAVGQLLSGGSTEQRLGYGLLGIAAGWVLIWFLIHVTLIVYGTRSALKPQPQPPPKGPVPRDRT